MKPDPELVGELLGLFAHDLRNPLSALQSNASYLESTPGIDQDSLEAIADLLVACDGLAHIIDNLDVFSRSLKDAQEHSGRRFTTATLVRDVSEKSQRLSASHGFGLSVSVPDDVGGLELALVGDGPVRALGNLIANSLQHAPGGSSVEITAAQHGSDVLISVRDQGTRIEPSAAPEAFSLRGQISVKASGMGRYGRGLGLFAAAASAEAAGARIEIGEGPANHFVLVCPTLGQ
ncbi:MAG: HAMP domain-containing histidine kinase [Myxococcales bacterium]|nr:HAMP domain-containing histidine kinase [Myxococcales bacterium]